MTVISKRGTKPALIDRNVVLDAIRNNAKIEDKLHVIVVISNPVQYKRRFELARRLVARFKIYEPNCILYIVELAYGKQPFAITDPDNSHHLQIRTDTCPLWHKENMINIGVAKLLPAEWRAFAWIDADLEFESHTWAEDTLRLLNGQYDIVQLFSHCVDKNYNGETLNHFNSAGFQLVHNRRHYSKPPNYSHPGFAWAMTRCAYERIGGLYENAILGSGDNITMLSLLSRAHMSIHTESHPAYVEDILQYEKTVHTLRFGYVPGVIIHNFHGQKHNRKYRERWHILLKYGFNPRTFITRDERGLIIPTAAFPTGLKKEIMDYFRERNEDEYYSYGRT